MPGHPIVSRENPSVFVALENSNYRKGALYGSAVTGALTYGGYPWILGNLGVIVPNFWGQVSLNRNGLDNRAACGFMDNMGVATFTAIAGYSFGYTPLQVSLASSLISLSSTLMVNFVATSERVTPREVDYFVSFATSAISATFMHATNFNFNYVTTRLFALTSLTLIPFASYEVMHKNAKTEEAKRLERSCLSGISGVMFTSVLTLAGASFGYSASQSAFAAPLASMAIATVVYLTPPAVKAAKSCLKNLSLFAKCLLPEQLREAAGAGLGFRPFRR